MSSCASWILVMAPLENSTCESGTDFVLDWSIRSHDWVEGLLGGQAFHQKRHLEGTWKSQDSSGSTFI